MSDSRQKFDDIEESKSFTGLGMFTQTTTQDEYLGDILDDYFVKNNETLIRDILDEVNDWNNQWKSWEFDGVEKPINADEFAKELSKKYKITLQ